MLLSALLSWSEISTISGSRLFRLRGLGRWGGHDEVVALDGSDEDGDGGDFEGLEGRGRGKALLLTDLGFPPSFACSVGVTDSSGACVISVSLSLPAFLLVVVVVPTGAGGSLLRTHSPFCPTPRVYQSGVSSTLSFLAIMRRLLYNRNAQCASFAASSQKER